MIYSINQEKQQLFAEVSGDYNPLHIDGIYAARSMFGKQVVHGIHLVLKALDVFAASVRMPIYLKKIEVKFEDSLGIGEEFDIVAENSANHGNIRIVNKEKSLAADISFDYEKRRESVFKSKNDTYAKSPQEHTDYDNLSGTEQLGYDQDKFNMLFSDAGKFLSVINIAVLLSSTRIVGMKCPGLHSVYNLLSVDFSKLSTTGTVIAYKVVKFHKALNMVAVELSDCAGMVIGKLRAFIRPTAPRQKNIAALQCLVDDNIFSGQRALVVGGSRGIGAQCVKLLLLGGADVMFSYRSSRKEADALAAECNNYGKINNFIQLDVANISDQSLSMIKAFRPTHIYYFATPHISGSSSALSAEKFNDFGEIYIFSLHKLIAAVGTDIIKGIFYPSSTAIDELPNGMVEYALAKYAAELYAEYMRRKMNLYVYNPRFPRIETEQTMNLLGLKAESPENVLQIELMNFIAAESRHHG